MHSRHTWWGIFAASFSESIVVPIPLELLLIPMMQLNRSRMWNFALAALLGCIVGASFGYAVGLWLLGSVGEWIVSLYGGERMLEKATKLIREHGFWFIFSVGISPISFQVAMVTAGATGYAFTGFMTATVLSRSIRYFGLAALVWRFGGAAEYIYREHKKTAAVALMLFIALAWVVFGFIL